MNDKTRTIALLLLFIAVGVFGRLACVDLPNFSPTVALAALAGCLFASRSTALLVPLSVMLISNFWLDSYLSLGGMIVVYLALMFPVLLAHQVRRRDQQGWSVTPVGLGLCAVLPSIVFFVSSNFAVWLFSGLYTSTVDGLVTCYAQALPFYGYSLSGDLIFVPLVFGVYYAARRFSDSPLRASRTTA